MLLVSSGKAFNKFMFLKKPSTYVEGSFKRQNCGAPCHIYGKNAIFFIRKKFLLGLCSRKSCFSPKYSDFILWFLEII